MDDQTLIEEFVAWLAELPADFAFLLALPFVVALAALLQYAASGERRAKREAREAAEADERQRAERQRTERQHPGVHHRWQRTH